MPRFDLDLTRLSESNRDRRAMTPMRGSTRWEKSETENWEKWTRAWGLHGFPATRVRGLGLRGLRVVNPEAWWVVVNSWKPREKDKIAATSASSRSSTPWIPTWTPRKGKIHGPHSLVSYTTSHLSQNPSHPIATSMNPFF